MDISTWLPTVLPVIISIGAGLGGAAYARRKGLPEVQAEVDQATKDLISLLKDQLALANADLAKLRPQLAASNVRIAALEEEVDRKEQRIVQLIIRINELEEKLRRHTP